MTRSIRVLAAAVAALALQTALAGDSPQEQRHELMEDVRAGAKTIGKMLEGEAPFDAAAAMGALQTWREAGAVFGTLFPEGSETGFETKAKPAIWSDRTGFEAALLKWVEATDAAIAANPQSLEDLQGAAGPVFKACKGCHENYRVDD